MLESQYYHDQRKFPSETGAQAIELHAAMGDKPGTEQVEKYIQLKVDKELAKAMKLDTERTVEGLVNHGVDVFYDRHDDHEDAKEYRKRSQEYYGGLLEKAFELSEQYDATQESIDRWVKEIERVENVLHDKNNAALYYMGRITPENLHIKGEYIETWDEDTDEPWTVVNKGKSIPVKNAIEEASNFYRPGITKLVLKAREAGSDHNIAELMGIDM
jgi:hypothetical protein